VLVEDDVYATIERFLQTGAHTQTRSEAETFLQPFPHSLRRSQMQFWRAEALYATRACRPAAEGYSALLQLTPTGPQSATGARQLGLSSLSVVQAKVPPSLLLQAQHALARV
jgi:TolA-binding protein